MKRLLEQSPADRAEQRLTELVRRAEPASVNPFQKRQVWVRLAAMRQTPRRPSWTTRVLWGVALLGCGTATAALSNEWLNSASVEPPPSGEEREKLGEDRTSSVPQKAPAPVEAPGADATAEIEPQPEVQQKAAPKMGVRGTGRSARPKDVGAGQVTDGEDPSQVIAAIRAWRSERDAVKARGLLNGYLRDNPGGALAEDALALLIEVASAQKDPRAAGYAKRYLSAYPKGRFRAMAQRVFDASP